MQFAYFGYDFMLGTVHRLRDSGHRLAGIFTFPCDNRFNFNRKTLALAAQAGVPVTQERVLKENMDALMDAGCTCFIAAGYPWKIPPIDETRAYGLNIHPAYLPAGRGIMPLPYIILGNREAAGLTIHKLSPAFDTGDILWQEPIDLAPQETVDSLSGRIAAAAPGALATLMADLPRYWREAKPQDNGRSSWFPPPDDAMRTLDFTGSIADADRVARAFGSYGCLAAFENSLWSVYSHGIRAETHTLSPGTAARKGDLVEIACRDGFVILKKFGKITVE